MKKSLFSLLAVLAVSATDAPAQFGEQTSVPAPHSVVELPDGSVLADDITGTYLYPSWSEYFTSGFFFRHGKRCGADALLLTAAPNVARGQQSDCSSTRTNPATEYDPNGGGATVYDIPVVFHVFRSNNGSGNIADARIHEQIQILNDDFASLTNSRIQFHLATEDPNGNPTDGINRYQNRNWFNDRGDYASQVGWDTNRYLNIYSNTAGGNLGYAYVPNSGGVVGQSFDGVRLFYQSIGYTNYTPYNLGRTGTHEVGHYLGLYHTFDGGCGTSDCYGSGDLICDTNPESSPNYSACQPSQRVTCGSQDPVRNYMDYSEDACMDEFTHEQAMRMRCTLDNWRVDLTTWENGGGTGGTPPAQVSGGSPANGATGVDANTALGWSAASGATQYDVYFGTSANPGLVSANQGGTSYDPGALTAGATYFWRVDSENADGTTTGDVWSFTVATGGGSGGGNLFFDGFEDGNVDGWSTSGRVGTSGTANSGSSGAQVRRAGTLSRTIVTGAETNVTVSFAWADSGFDASDTATATITHAGGTVTLTHDDSLGGWSSESVGGLTGPITLTFDVNADRNNERFYIDDVSADN